jgi:putative hemolysin
VNTTSVALVLACLAAQLFFTTADVALGSASRAELRERAAAGDNGAQVALLLLEAHSDRLTATALIGANVALVAGTTVTGLLLTEQGLADPWWWAGAYLPAALLLGEMLPRQLARPYADALAPALAPSVQAVQWALTPLLWALSRWTALLRRVLPPESEAIRREDIVQLLDDRENHSIDPEDRAFIRRLLALSEITAAEAMTPLVDVHAVAEDATVADAIRKVLEFGHSRLPVFRERVDNLVGRIELMDLLTASDHDPVSVYVRTIPFVPDSKRADVLLREMRASLHSFAAVVDEYGGSVGIVTMEDLLEQVVGDIVDERDMELPGIRKVSDHEWRVPARTPIEDLEEAIGRTVPPGEYETVAGLLLAHTGRIPQSGTQIRIGRLVFHVEAASERAVHLVRVLVPTDPP